MLKSCVINDLFLRDNGSDQGDCEWPVTEFPKPLANPQKIKAKPLTWDKMLSILPNTLSVVRVLGYLCYHVQLAVPVCS